MTTNDSTGRILPALNRSRSWCRKAERLLAAHNSALLDASTAGKKLADLAGMASGDTFIFLCNEKTRANAHVKQAQAAYEKNITNHGCGKEGKAEESLTQV